MFEEAKELCAEIRPKRPATYYQRMVMADLMTKYYGVKNKVPCACPSTIKEIIGQLDKLNDDTTSGN